MLICYLKNRTGGVSVDWKVKTFEALSLPQLYHILQERVAVFVVEQNCPYQEVDGADQASSHLFLEKDDQIVAYARLIPKGVLYDVASIGRIFVHKDYRKEGYGRELLAKAIEIISVNWREDQIKLHAQVYLRDFYQSFAFKEVTEEYLEDGIPHVDMVRVNPTLA